MQTKTLMACALALAAWTGMAAAKLPPPTPEQVAAQAAKKAAADAQAEKDKQVLLARMDTLTAQAAKKAAADAQAEKDKQVLLARMDTLTAAWRGKAGEKGWKLNAPTPLPAPAAALTAPATQSAPSGQPDGKMTVTGAAAPMTSEKAGTAVPSKDVKPAPSPAASTVKTK